MSSLNKKMRGFTIIEVLIVLAIAGVIMLVVFLAVPALQRQSRNTQRRADASHMAALITEWQANHGGTALTKLNDSTNAAGPDLTNENFQAIAKPAANTVVGAWSSAPASPVIDTFYVFSGATCNGSSAVNSGGGVRSVVVIYYVEPGVTLQCV
jgi:prepilin-type N-terminal cleavage/methylation domain-containing protein